MVAALAADTPDHRHGHRLGAPRAHRGRRGRPRVERLQPRRAARARGGRRGRIDLHRRVVVFGGAVAMGGRRSAWPLECWRSALGRGSAYLSCPRRASPLCPPSWPPVKDLLAATQAAPVDGHAGHRHGRGGGATRRGHPPEPAAGRWRHPAGRGGGVAVVVGRPWPWSAARSTLGRHFAVSLQVAIVGGLVWRPVTSLPNAVSASTGPAGTRRGHTQHCLNRNSLNVWPAFDPPAACHRVGRPVGTRPSSSLGVRRAHRRDIGDSPTPATGYAALRVASIIAGYVAFVLALLAVR